MDADRQNIINNVARSLRDIDQLFIDCEYWNELHSDQQPVDADPDGLMDRIRTAYRNCLANEASLGNYPSNNLAPAMRRHQIPIQLDSQGMHEAVRDGGLTGHGRN